MIVLALSAGSALRMASSHMITCRASQEVKRRVTVGAFEDMKWCILNRHHDIAATMDGHLARRLFCGEIPRSEVLGRPVNVCLEDCVRIFGDICPTRFWDLVSADVEELVGEDCEEFPCGERIREPRQRQWQRGRPRFTETEVETEAGRGRDRGRDKGNGKGGG